MKRLLTVLITLLCFAWVVNAQVIVTSTTAVSKKVHSKSERVKGLVIRPEIGVGFDLGEQLFCPSLTVTANYQFNPYIGVGMGFGTILSDYYLYGYYRYLAFPIYANIRGYFADRKVSPYYDINIGYGANVSSLYVGGGVGINWKNFDFGLNVSYLGTIYGNYPITFRFAYNFQFPKK